MNTPRTQAQRPQRESLAAQLAPLRDQVPVDEGAMSDAAMDSSVLPFPVLYTAEEIQPPDDILSTEEDSTVNCKLRSNTAHWVEFEKQVESGDFATAKTVVDFLDQDAQLKAALCGLYVKACITIKREQIKYAQTQDAAEKAAETASADEKAQAALVAAEQAREKLQREEADRKAAALLVQRQRESSVWYWLGRGFQAMRSHPQLALPGLAGFGLVLYQFVSAASSSV